LFLSTRSSILLHVLAWTALQAIGKTTAVAASTAVRSLLQFEVFISPFELWVDLDSDEVINDNRFQSDVASFRAGPILEYSF